MDLKALMQKLETINTKQTLTESAKKEQTDKKECPPMSHVKKMCQDGKSVAEICKMHPDCDHTELKQMVADCKETMDKDKEKTNEGITFTSSIARGLVEEFGYELDEEQVSEVAFSPEQQAKMGKANPQDPYIVARVLGKDAVPLSHFTDPEDKAIAKQMGFKDGPAAPAPAAPAAPAPAAPAPAAPAPAAPAPAAPAPRIGLKPPKYGAFGTETRPLDGSDDRREGGQGFKMPMQAPVTSVAANPTDARLAAGAQTANTAAPAKPAAADPAVAAKREKFKALMDKLEKTGGVTGSAPAVKETVQYKDDQTLLAIKNIRY